MKLLIEIEMDNAAFDPDWKHEAKRIIEEAALAVDYGNLGPGQNRNLRDINGNFVGSLQITEEG